MFGLNPQFPGCVKPRTPNYGTIPVKLISQNFWLPTLADIHKKGVRRNGFPHYAHLNSLLYGPFGTSIIPSFILLNLRNENTSFLVLDHKGYLYSKAKFWLINRGYQVIVMNYDTVPPFCIGDLFQTKTALFLSYSDMGNESANISKRLGDMLNSLYAARKFPRKYPVEVIIPGFDYIDPIFNIKEMLSCSGGNNISFSLTIASWESYKKALGLDKFDDGDDLAKWFCGTFVYFGGALKNEQEISSLEYLLNLSDAKQNLLGLQNNKCLIMLMGQERPILDTKFLVSDDNEL